MDGYIYNAAEEPKILMTGKWNESLSYQPCDLEGEPIPGTELKEVIYGPSLSLSLCHICSVFDTLHERQTNIGWKQFMIFPSTIWMILN